jgi:acyl-CoA synthetase (NDP forming)
VDIGLFFSAGFGALAPQVATMFEDLRDGTDKPICLSWLSPPAGITQRFAEKGIIVFDKHARVIRAAGHIARYAADLRHRIRHHPDRVMPFRWGDFVDVAAEKQVIPENLAARILEAAGLPVAAGRLARTTEEAVRAASAVGYPVVIKGIAPAITHRAAAGLVRLGLEDAAGVEQADRALRARAVELGVTLDGTWVQHMVAGNVELLVAAIRDTQFGVMVGCGMGGAMTEIIDDVAFVRAPIDAEGAFDLIGCLRTVARLPALLSDAQRSAAAAFIARFSTLVAGAPWRGFTFEINPVKLGSELAAVDALLVID